MSPAREIIPHVPQVYYSTSRRACAALNAALFAPRHQTPAPDRGLAGGQTRTAVFETQGQQVMATLSNGLW
jgi:hypothetical protein